MTSYSTQNQWPGSNTFKLSFLLGPLLRCSSKKNTKRRISGKNICHRSSSVFYSIMFVGRMNGWCIGVVLIVLILKLWAPPPSFVCLLFVNATQPDTTKWDERVGRRKSDKQLFYSSFKDPLLWLNNKKGDESMHYQSQQQPTSW